MSDAKAKLQTLIRAQQFDDARRLVKQLNHPQTDKMLQRINQLEKQAQQQKPVLKPSPKVVLTAEQPDQVPSRLSSQLSKKPLPMTLEEERQAMPKGRPDKPGDILDYRFNEGALGIRSKISIMIMNILMGMRAVTLASNYRRLDRPDLFMITTFIYFALIGGEIVAFLLIITAIQSSNISMLIIAAVLVSMTMIYPYILASIQEPLYQKWIEKYHQ